MIKERFQLLTYLVCHIILNQIEIFQDLFKKNHDSEFPGLIEGASYNVGMGHRFLRHVERTKLLVFIVDINGFQLNLSSGIR